MEKRGEDNGRQKGQAIKSFVPLLLTILVLFSVFLLLRRKMLRWSIDSNGTSW